MAMKKLFPALGASIAMAGADKLAGDRAYSGMFRQLGWSEGDMQAAAMAEFAGGIMMTTRSMRRLGGLVVTVASGAILASEIRHDENKLATPRAMVLLAGLVAFLTPGPRH